MTSMKAGQGMRRPWHESVDLGPLFVFLCMKMDQFFICLLTTKNPQNISMFTAS